MLSRLLYPLYEARLLRELKGARQPKHVAIMADGNRRWAKQAGHTDISLGHLAGARKISEMVNWCADTDVEIVTVYLLSTENLRREDHELQDLFEIIGDLVDELATNEYNCAVRLVGHLDLLPDHFADRLRAAAAPTKDCDGVTVNIAVGYGGRQEIVDAMRALIVEEAAAGTAVEEIAEKITVDSLSTYLYTSGQPDPDLVIRTSGEQRLSGFLLWQAAYSEIWFTDTYWPAFRRVDFLRALREYSGRSRRFGK
ncbi:isoprenyl transferase [Corynebacterium alimapuense]|uniref:Isoprenyl transferase n=1 Tax=Corynebacterium alimapuense TaxID=1576874 RepID=A0A3M8K5P5_9CORY|nr:isoprenyl transferase [Corynebacterium alimapuense]RNE48531.1 isoprenyl transferase [Corynebacterium alimapuense]